MEINSINYLNQLTNQTTLEKIKTEKEVEYLNKKLMKDGKKIDQELGKEDFLKLLITELQHQDPTNPMQDREFITQMAQFSALEQMMNFNKSMTQLLEKVSFQSSFNLLGMNVEVEQVAIDTTGETKKISGIVQAIIKNTDEVFVRVNGEDYPLRSVTKVSH